MTSHIDQLLAQARLVNEPYSQEQIDVAAARIAARVAAHRVGPEPETGPAPGGPSDPAAQSCAAAAAQDLRTLCETAVMSTGALKTLRRFVAPSLPEPAGARVLACILQLTEREDAARFWWQYAAGAGDHAAVYCLYLHHTAHGEDAEAQWWHAQAQLPPAHSKEEAGQHEFSAALRVLRGLQTEDETQDLITRTARVSAVLAYVPAAVAYVDDTLDLPLPDPDFADRITSLTTTPAPTPAPVLVPKWHNPTSLPGPPARRRAPSPATAGRSTAAKTTSAWQWNDSGGAFGHAQRTGDFTAARRREQAWHAFWQHCENCAACDPAGTPCPAYGTLW